MIAIDHTVAGHALVMECVQFSRFIGHEVMLVWLQLTYVSCHLANAHNYNEHQSIILNIRRDIRNMISVVLFMKSKMYFFLIFSQ